MGRDLSGVGVYSREILKALAEQRPDVAWDWLYRPHRFLKSGPGASPGVMGGVTRGLLLEHALFRRARLFHGLNQRLPRTRFPFQIATFHDLFVMTAGYSTPEFRARFTAQAKHAAAAADHIIAVSAFTASQIVNLLGVEPARITVIPHGIRPIHLPELPKEDVILHVGAVQSRKNLVRLVRAFETVPSNWKLVLAGSDGFGADAIYRAITDSPARPRILLTGYLDDAALDAWYARASIFAFPSLDEGFGMPVLEAMACGIPVLTSNGSALNEIAGGHALLVDPRDQTQITAGLHALVSDGALRQRLVHAALPHAARYNWTRSAAETLSVYRKFIRQP